ncbi:hypothetical protein N0B51_05145 [Tsuneonella sp. YG55]|uniref:Lipoprotein n=1 Tax=Tsuneonella litorea TaxID=2976475 RepID=A0A9X3A7G0_9SPHN|nr:hypothetical protein [Tsuneonella litorea]MCT2558361.1 hypothetical protein [Tsuneonella litorea]
MNKLALLLPLLALAACGQEQPAPEPTPAQTVTAAPVSTLPAPDREHFAEAFAAGCTGAEPVKNATCKRAGMGSDNVVCQYGLGDDEYLRHTATMGPNADKTGWVLTDAATVCTEHGAETTETAASESQ